MTGNREIVISEARLSSSVILVAAPVLLGLGTIIAGFSGRSLEDGIYYRAFGPIVYLVVYGGAAYAFYEFSKIIRGRSRYVTYRDGYIHILAQASVRLSQIRSVTIERHLTLKNLVIKTADGSKTRIRGHFLQRGLEEVRNSIQTLQETEKR